MAKYTKHLVFGKTHITMSSQEHQPPIYHIPNHPSRQLKVVLDYFDSIKRWDFDALSKLFTSDFTQHVLPMSLGSSPRTKNEYIEYIHTLRESLKGGPLKVCDQGPFPPRFSELTSLRRLLYTMSMRTRAKFGSTHVPSLIPFSSHKATYHLSTLLRALVQMFVKSGNIEGIFKFTFGTDKDENLIANLTEFVDSKVYASGGHSDDSEGRSSSHLNARPGSGAQPDSETNTRAPST
jgi:hypothetical protein